LTSIQPLYTPDNTTAAYELNWGLTVFWRGTPIPDDGWFAALQAATEPDDVRILKHEMTTGDASQFFVSTKPHVAPKDLVRSVKGRLQHEIRARAPKALQRNYCLRSIGSATRTVVEGYVADQLGHHRMADPDVQKRLARFQRSYPDVDLSQPSFSSHGEYWYNLHVVFVNDERWMEIRESVLEQRLVTIEAAAVKHGHRLSRAAVLADHVHLTLGCEISESPEQVVLGYMNNCAYVCGMKPEFRFSYYVGTFGEYDRGAV
jgi:REP element-mobilizing transposase RayT